MLDEMINTNKLRVFLNCTNGVSRAPTLAVLYLTLFVRHEKWDNLEELERYVKRFYPMANANLDIIERIIDEHSEF